MPRFSATAATRIVCSSGRVRYRGHLVYVGQGFSGYRIGLCPIDDNYVQIQFYELDLGLFSLVA
jgi:hypothetical protein